MKNKFGLVIFYVLIFALFIFFLSRVLASGMSTKPLETYSEVVDYFVDNKVVAFEIDQKNLLTMKVLSEDQSGALPGSPKTEIKTYQLRSLDLFYTDLADIIEQNHTVIPEGQTEPVLQEYEYEPPTQWPWWLSLLPYLLLIVVFVVLWIIYMNSAVGGKGGAGKISNFGKARVKTPQADKSKVLFSDVAGADEEKAELQEVVQFLRDPSKFTRLGAKIPHGVLLVGPPGTGKTLLAKAVAGEAGVPFLSISGSDFVEMYVGVGASRVRDLFETARKATASIIFIDEIDAVGRHRGAGLGGGHDEREQTLNQLLVEMDGFGSHDGVIVIAATNRPDILDPALLRPGRFDRQITVGYPDLQGRYDILKVHARNKPLEENVDLNEIAKMTVGFTGADLANLLNEAALLAARRNKSLIGMYDIKDALIRVEVGPNKKHRSQKESELKKTAYHEAGHAIIYHVLPDLDPVTQISIIPSGRALGYTMSAPQEDRFSEYKEELKHTISALLGGRAAEELIFGNVSGGASNDIERATKIAQKMVTKLGMSDVLGPICYGSDQGEIFLGRDFSSSQDYSDATAMKIDEEIHKIVTDAYALAKKILNENIEKLHFIAGFLLKNEVMDGEQFLSAMEGNPTYEDLENMTEAKLRKSREENDRKIAEDAKKAQEEAQKQKRAEEHKKHPGDTFGMEDPGMPKDDQNSGNDNRFDGNH